jgi:hypothetical protein
MKLPTTPGDAADPKKPRSTWDTIVTSTPVVMTVLATILAGLSSSEMSQSQYYRSLSAQHQSKAGDQWNFFQAKKLRAADASNSEDLQENLGDVSPISVNALTALAAQAALRLEGISQASAAYKDAAARAQALRAGVAAAQNDADVRQAIASMTGPLAPAPEVKIADADVRRAYEAVKSGQEDNDVKVFAAVKEPAVREALRAARDNTAAAENELEPAAAGIAKLRKLLDEVASAAVTARLAARPASQAASQPADVEIARPSDRGVPTEVRQLAGDFSAARKHFEANRHEREARLNQQTAYLYEVMVRKTDWESERHRVRSRYFFFGMLAAQAAVTIATLSLAVKERSWLWTMAATIGVLALAYAGYVYLFT